MQIKVLLAEDEPDLAAILAAYMKREGYSVTICKDGETALAAMHEQRFDLMVLDWMMPGLSGIEVAKAAKAASDAKLIMITAKSTQEDEWLSLSSGLDDYIRKPFDPKILMLRIKKILNLESKLICGALCVDTSTSQVYLENTLIDLTAKEYELLCYLMRHQDKLLNRQQLIDAVWGYDFDGDNRTVDTQVKRLRSKIGESYITTIRGMGYRFGL